MTRIAQFSHSIEQQKEREENSCDVKNFHSHAKLTRWSVKVKSSRNLPCYLLNPKIAFKTLFIVNSLINFLASRHNLETSSSESLASIRK